MWHCCSYGTHLLDEADVFTRDTGPYGYWVDYRPKEPDMVGFAVEVTGYKNETVIGNVYDVGNYYSHAQYVRENSLIIDSVSLTYANDWGINAGKTITVPRYEYDKDRHRLMSESGNVTAIKYHPWESTKTMADLLKVEKAKYMGMPAGDVHEYLKNLDKKLTALREEPVPNLIFRIYHADYIDPDNSPLMEIIAAMDDADALKQANEICTETTGITLVELNEVSENGDMREVVIVPQTAEMSRPAEITPDPSITAKERNEYGYGYDEILPLNQDRAMELFAQDCAIYLLWNDDTESMVNDLSEITKHDGIFGIERADWINSEQYNEVTAFFNSVDNVQSGRANPDADNMERIIADAPKYGIPECYVKPLRDSFLPKDKAAANETKSPQEKSTKQEEPQKNQKPNKPKKAYRDER
jgi:hypothetical protein